MHRWLREKHIRNSQTSQAAEGEHWDLLGSRFLQGQQCCGDPICDIMRSRNDPGHDIKTAKTEYRCSKTETNGENVIRNRLFIWRRLERRKGGTRATKRVVKKQDKRIGYTSWVTGAFWGSLWAALCWITASCGLNKW